MNVKECLKRKGRELVTVGPDASVREAMKLLLANKISCLPVVAEDRQLIGIISDKDIFRHAFEKPDTFTETTVRDLMTTNVIVGLLDDTLDYIGGVMTKNRIRHVPIIRERSVIGLVSVGDIVGSRLTSVEIENRYLRQFIKDQYPG
jgi:CBS domain-containing protein